MRKLVTDKGAPVTPSAAFASLRDNRPSGNPDIEFRRAHYDSDIFVKLDKVGFTRDSLQIAWDFTVMSTYSMTNRIVTMRDDAFARTAQGIKYTITQTHDNPSSSIARSIRGVMLVPWYLTQVT
jgi:hypothetical protein